MRRCFAPSTRDFPTEVNVMIFAALITDCTSVDGWTSRGSVTNFFANLARLDRTICKFVAALTGITINELVDEVAGVHQVASFVTYFTSSVWT